MLDALRLHPKNHLARSLIAPLRERIETFRNLPAGFERLLEGLGDA